MAVPLTNQHMYALQPPPLRRACRGSTSLRHLHARNLFRAWQHVLCWSVKCPITWQLILSLQPFVIIQNTYINKTVASLVSRGFRGCCPGGCLGSDLALRSFWADYHDRSP